MCKILYLLTLTISLFFYQTSLAFQCPFLKINNDDCKEYLEIKNNYIYLDETQKKLAIIRLRNIENNLLTQEERDQEIQLKINSNTIQILKNKLPENVFQTIHPLKKMYISLSKDKQMKLISYYINGDQIDKKDSHFIREFLNYHKETMLMVNPNKSINSHYDKKEDEFMIPSL